jgi:site-specific recombinase XerD
LADSSARTVLPLDQNPAAVYLATLRPSGRRTMRTALDIMAGMLSNGRYDALSLPWHELNYQHTAALVAALQQKYRPATTNKMLAALRRVLKEAWRLGLLDAEAYRRATDLPAVKGETLLRGRALEGTEIGALIEACSHDSSPMGVRDAALLAVLYGAGLRRSEIVNLDLKDYNSKNQALTIRGGKGNKDRLTYLGEDAAELLKNWLAVRGPRTGSLFCRIYKGNKLSFQGLTDQAVLWLLQKRAKEAGIDSFSPHDLRRTYISDLLDAGVDIATVQKLAGHANVETTARYDRRGEATKRKAASALRIPRKPPE